MKFYLKEAIDCGIVKTFTDEYCGTKQVLIPFRNNQTLSVVSTTKKRKAEMKEIMGGREWTGLYEKLGYEVWDYDKGLLPNGGPVSMSEEMINDFVNGYIKEMGKDFSFIIPANEIKIVIEEDPDEDDESIDWNEEEMEEAVRLIKQKYNIG